MHSENIIKVGFLISYDYDLIKQSLPMIYPYADKIFFAIDKERKTWKGNVYQLPDMFFEWIKEFDRDNKIHIYEDSFYLPDFTPIFLETRERNMLARYMGESGWHIQIDVDEYFLNFKEFVDNIKLLKNPIPTEIYAEWIVIFKQDATGIFIVNPSGLFPIATNFPFYIHARRISSEVKRLKINAKIIHQSWGRNETELKFKLENWGHSNDIDWSDYLNFWRSVNKDNYKKVRDFHPFTPSSWSNLKYLDLTDSHLDITNIDFDEESKEYIALLDYYENNYKSDSVSLY